MKLDVGNDGLDALHVNTGAFAGTLLSELDLLDYTTYVPAGDHCAMAPYIVLFVRTPDLGPDEFDILIYDPGVDNDPAPMCETWLTWHARSGRYRSILHPEFAPQNDPQPLDDYDAMFGLARLVNLAEPTAGCPNTVGGLRIEVGHGGSSEGGLQNVVGFVESQRIKVQGQPAQEFDF